MADKPQTSETQRAAEAAARQATQGASNTTVANQATVAKATANPPTSNSAELPPMLKQGRRK